MTKANVAVQRSMQLKIYVESSLSHHEPRTICQTKAPALLPYPRAKQFPCDCQTMANRHRTFTALDGNRTVPRGRTHYRDAGDSTLLCTFGLSASKDKEPWPSRQSLHVSKTFNYLHQVMTHDYRRLSDKLRLRLRAAEYYTCQWEELEKEEGNSRDIQRDWAAADAILTRPCHQGGYYKSLVVLSCHDTIKRWEFYNISCCMVAWIASAAVSIALDISACFPSLLFSSSHCTCVSAARKRKRSLSLNLWSCVITGGDNWMFLEHARLWPTRPWFFVFYGRESECTEEGGVACVAIVCSASRALSIPQVQWMSACRFCHGLAVAKEMFARGIWAGEQSLGLAYCTRFMVTERWPLHKFLTALSDCTATFASSFPTASDTLYLCIAAAMPGFSLHSLRGLAGKAFPMVWYGTLTLTDVTFPP